MNDLNDCSARWQEPISTDYGDYTVYEAPPIPADTSFYRS